MTAPGSGARACARSSRSSRRPTATRSARARQCARLLEDAEPGAGASTRSSARPTGWATPTSRGPCCAAGRDAQDPREQNRVAQAPRHSTRQPRRRRGGGRRVEARRRPRRVAGDDAVARGRPARPQAARRRGSTARLTALSSAPSSGRLPELYAALANRAPTAASGRAALKPRGAGRAARRRGRRAAESAARALDSRPPAPTSRDVREHRVAAGAVDAIERRRRRPSPRRLPREPGASRATRRGAIPGAGARARERPDARRRRRRAPPGGPRRARFDARTTRARSRRSRPSSHAIRSRRAPRRPALAPRVARRARPGRGARTRLIEWARHEETPRRPGEGPRAPQARARRSMPTTTRRSSAVARLALATGDTEDALRPCARGAIAPRGRAGRHRCRDGAGAARADDAVEEASRRCARCWPTRPANPRRGRWRRSCSRTGRRARRPSRCSSKRATRPTTSRPGAEILTRLHRRADAGDGVDRGAISPGRRRRRRTSRLVRAPERPAARSR